MRFSTNLNLLKVFHRAKSWINKIKSHILYSFSYITSTYIGGSGGWGWQAKTFHKLKYLNGLTSLNSTSNQRVTLLACRLLIYSWSAAYLAPPHSLKDQWMICDLLTDRPQKQASVKQSAELSCDIGQDC